VSRQAAALAWRVLALLLLAPALAAAQSMDPRVHETKVH
jgi:hypothetical protein